MGRKRALIVAALMLCGGAVYFALLWEPFGGWLFDHVIPLLPIGPTDRNPNFLEGLGIMLLSLCVLAGLFLLPYLLLCVIAALAVSRLMKRPR